MNPFLDEIFRFFFSYEYERYCAYRVFKIAQKQNWRCGTVLAKRAGVVGMLLLIRAQPVTQRSRTRPRRDRNLGYRTHACLFDCIDPTTDALSVDGWLSRLLVVCPFFRNKKKRQRPQVVNSRGGKSTLGLLPSLPPPKKKRKPSGGVEHGKRAK